MTVQPTCQTGHSAPGSNGAPQKGRHSVVKGRWVIGPGNLIQFLFAIATMLFFILPPGVLKLVGWDYLGGGPEFEKVHIATYLLVTAFVCLWFVDPRFRTNVTELCSDWVLISFALAVGTIAFYAVLVKHVSITPFI